MNKRALVIVIAVCASLLCGVAVGVRVSAYTNDALNTTATATAQAVRVSPPIPPVPPVPPVIESGLFGLPFAPPGSSDCERANFYAAEFGLPASFGDRPRSGPASQQGIAWRESNCENDATSPNGCCWGVWQHAFRSEIRDTAAGPIYVRCEVTVLFDYIGPSELAYQKNACVAAGKFHIFGYGPWKV